MTMHEENIRETNVTNILSKSFIDYSMSVIISRALPDVRDGLKPVHRRILYAMGEMPVPYNRSHKKSAKIVGEVMANLHPHGDSAIYETLVRMAQPFKMRAPLVDGQGNFGSMYGDPAAAMRYTESRMAKIAHEFLKDINCDTVDFQPNFDGEMMEPIVLPTRIPNILVNGTEGIAVGMATSMPPHNLREVCQAVLAQMDNPDITIDEIMEIVPGPDFPTGAKIMGSAGTRKAYETGKGTIVVRAIIEKDYIDGRDALVIKEIPYQITNVEKLIDSIKNIQKDYNETQRLMNKNTKTAKKIEQKGMNFIHELRDETDNKNDKNDVRIVIELKEGTNPDAVIKYLYKNTSLQSTFSFNNLALVPKKYGENQIKMVPKLLGIKDIITEYIKHQQEITERKLRFDLRKNEADMFMLEAVIRALGKLDETIQIIKDAKTTDLAKQELMKFLDIEEKQAQHILALQLRTLANAERDEKIEAHRKTALEIEEIKEKLADPEKINQIIKDDVARIMEEYGEDRLTKIEGEAEAINAEDLINDEDMVITMTRNGLIKRIPESKYKTQRKNGRGVNGMNTHEGDFVKHLQVARNLDTLMFFTNLGKVYKTKSYNIPMTNAQSKGVSIRSIFDFEEGEYVQAILSIDEFTEEQFVVFGTKRGIVNRTNLMDFGKSTRNGIKAIELKGDDEVVNVSLTNGDKYITLITKKGISISFEEKDVKVISRGGKGVKCIDLAKDDVVVSLSAHKGFSHLFIATNLGFGKRTPLSEFRIQNRGGKGVRAINTNEKNGYVIGTCVAEEDEQLILLTKNGVIIKMNADDVTSFSRNAQGSRVINLKEDDELIAVDRNSEDDEEVEMDELDTEV